MNANQVWQVYFIPIEKDYLVYSVNGNIRASILCQKAAKHRVKDLKMSKFIQDYDPFINRANGEAIKEVHSECKDQCLADIKQRTIEQLAQAMMR